MTTKEATRSKRVEDALARVRTDAKEVEKLEQSVSKLKNRMAKSALVARKGGVGLKEIAENAGYSIGWVQQAIVSVGYEPRAYKTASNGDEKS